jgi:hypothetical protein
VAIDVLYRATGPEATYNMFDWGVFVDDSAAEQASALGGPKPELSSGDLPQGKKVAGWIIYEVPGKGRVVVSYMPTHDSIFEVVLRPK